MKEKIIRILRALRILDESNNVSLTNMALVGAIVNVALRPEIDMNDLIALISTIVGYQIKRFAKNPNSELEMSVEELRKVVESTQTKITALQMGRNIHK